VAGLVCVTAEVVGADHMSSYCVVEGCHCCMVLAAVARVGIDEGHTYWR